jgi:hypothetical protein
MSTNTADELSLINDAEFLENLENVENVENWEQPTGRPEETVAESRQPFADAFDLLEQGLDVRPHAAMPASQAPFVPFVDVEREDVPDERRIPYAAAAIVLLVCLTAGAATAAVFFQDRLAQITAPRSASR